MADINRTVTTTEQSPAGAERVTQQSQHVRTTDRAATAVNVVRFLFGIIAILLALRFVLRLTAANPMNGFVHLIYAASKLFSAPFDSIFGVAAVQTRQAAQSVFEPSTLVAIAIYAIIAWGIVKLLTLNRPRV